MSEQDNDMGNNNNNFNNIRVCISNNFIDIPKRHK